MAVFAHRQQRIQVWDNASVFPVEGFGIGTLLQELLLLEHLTRRGVSNLRSAYSQCFPDRGFVVLGIHSYFCGVFGDGAAADFAAYVGGLCPQFPVCVFMPGLHCQFSQILIIAEDSFNSLDEAVNEKINTK